MRSCVYLIIVAVVIFGISCDEDSNDSDFTAYFYADNEDPHDNSVAMLLGYQNELRFEIDVVATEIDRAAVGAISFDLRFCPEYYEFRHYDKGHYLEQGGETTYSIAVAEDDPGLLHVRVEAATDSTGGSASGVFVVLAFRGNKLGEDQVCPFTFENQELRDLTQPERRLITGISWFAGKARIFK